MRRFFILIAFCFPLSLLAQWNISFNHSDQETAISVLNSDTAVAIAYAGARIHRTTNGGQSWIPTQTMYGASWFLDINFPSQSVGYACGGTAFGMFANVIIKTTDAGATWDSLTTNVFPGMTFFKLSFRDANIGMVAGETTLLVKTTDGGANFTQVAVPGSSSVTALSFEAPNYGVISTAKAIGNGLRAYAIHRTTDFGGTWSQVYTDTLNNTNGWIHRQIGDFEVVGPTHIYAVGGQGLFLKSTDAGLTWSTSILPPLTNMTTVEFTDVNTGYINNAGGIYKTTDGGQTWAVQNIFPLSIVLDIEFANAQTGYMVGENGIYKTENGGQMTAITDGVDGPRITIAPNPVLDYFSVRTDHSKIDEVRLYDARGKLVKRLKRGFDNISMTGLSSGYYTVSVVLDKATYRRKLLKME